VLEPRLQFPFGGAFDGGALGQGCPQVAGLQRGLHAPEDRLDAVACVSGGLDLDDGPRTGQHLAHDGVGFAVVVLLDDGFLEIALQLRERGHAAVLVWREVRDGQLAGGQIFHRRQFLRKGTPFVDGPSLT
jgi:hypothetical protein